MNYPLEDILLPMGGNTVKDEEKMDALWDDHSYVAEEKYDGSRYLSVGGRFFSRKVSVKTNFPVEKTANVPHLHFLQNLPDSLILDGEVYFHGMSSNDVTKIMGASPEKAISRQIEGGYLKYVVFDILRDMEGNWLIDKPWIERRNILESVVTTIKDNFPSAKHYLETSTFVQDGKREFYKEIMERGGEGVMLKDIKGKYHPDKKPAWNWIKVKKHTTADVIITGFKPAKRDYVGDELETHPYWERKVQKVLVRRSEAIIDESISADFATKYLQGIADPVTKFYYYGWIGSVTFSQYNADGELVDVGYCSGLSEELRQDMTENPDKYLGQVMEIGAMEVTKDGFYRHPQFSRFRDDKNARDCIVGVD